MLIRKLIAPFKKFLHYIKSVTKERKDYLGNGAMHRCSLSVEIETWNFLLNLEKKLPFYRKTHQLIWWIGLIEILIDNLIEKSSSGKFLSAIPFTTKFKDNMPVEVTNNWQITIRFIISKGWPFAEELWVYPDQRNYNRITRLDEL